MEIDKTEQEFFDKLEKLIPINDTEGVLYLRNNKFDVSLFMRGNHTNLNAMLIGVAYANEDFKRLITGISKFLEEHPTKIKYEELYKKISHSESGGKKN